MAVMLEGFMRLTDQFSTPIMQASQGLRDMSATAQSARASVNQALSPQQLDSFERELISIKEGLGQIGWQTDLNASKQNNHEKEIRESKKAVDDMNRSMSRNSSGGLLEKLKSISPFNRLNKVSQDNFTNSIDRSAMSAGGLASALKGVLSITALIAGARVFIGMADDVSQVTSRLSLMNDGLQSTSELNQMIHESAKASRGGYLETANAVASIGLQTEGLWESNQELIQFTEVLNKQFAIAGTSAEGQAAATLQMTQALGSGVLRGEELNSVLEQAPNIITLIQDELGIGRMELRQMASDGEITAEVVKTALLNAVDETNDAFNKMPMTWSQIWTQFKNEAINAFTPVAMQFSSLINSRGFQAMLSGLTRGLHVVADAFSVVMSLAETAFNWIYDNWDTLRPLFQSIAIAIGVVMVASLAQGVAGFVAMAGSALMALGPIGWIIAGVLAIGTIASATGQSIWDVISSIGDFIINVIGFLVGLIAGAVFFVRDVIFSTIAGLVNFFIGASETIQNGFITIKNVAGQVFTSISNAWKTVVYNLKKGVIDFVNYGISRFEGFINNIIRGFNGLIGMLNRFQISIPENVPLIGGTNFGFNLNTIDEVNLGRLDEPEGPNLEEFTPDNTVVEIPRVGPETSSIYYNEDPIMGIAEGMQWGMTNTRGLADKASGFIGEKIDGVKDKVGNFVDELKNGGLERMNQFDQPGQVEPLDIADVAKGIDGSDLSKNGKESKKKLDEINSELRRSSDDLSVIKDIMTQRAVTNVTWDKIEVQVSNSFGDIHEKADFNSWLGSLTTELEEAVNSSMTGVVALNE